MVCSYVTHNMDASIAFNNPTSGKIDQQRKILEDLERQKKQLLKSGNSGSLGAGMPPVPTPSTTESGGQGRNYYCQYIFVSIINSIGCPLYWSYFLFMEGVAHFSGFVTQRNIHYLIVFTTQLKLVLNDMI